VHHSTKELPAGSQGCTQGARGCVRIPERVSLWRHLRHQGRECRNSAGRGGSGAWRWYPGTAGHAGSTGDQAQSRRQGSAAGTVCLEVQGGVQYRRD